MYENRCLTLAPKNSHSLEKGNSLPSLRKYVLEKAGDRFKQLVPRLLISTIYILLSAAPFLGRIDRG